MKGWFRKLRYKLIRQFVAILTSETSNAAIALGFAIGTFIAVLPTPGLNWILCFLVALVYKKLNKLALFFSVVFWNPLFVAPVYAICYVVGAFVFDFFAMSQWSMVAQNPYIGNSGRFLTGNIIVTTLLAFISYHVALKVVSVYKKRRELKKLRKKDRPDKVSI